MEQLPTITDDDMQRIEDALKQQINAGVALRQELHGLVSTQVAEELAVARASIATAVQAAEEAKATASSTALKSETLSTELRQHIASLQGQYHAVLSHQQQQDQDAQSLAQRLAGLTERIACNITEQESARTIQEQKLAELRENAETQNRFVGETIEALSAKIEQYFTDAARQYSEQLALANRQLVQLQKRMNITVVVFAILLLISFLFALLGKRGIHLTQVPRYVVFLSTICRYGTGAVSTACSSRR